MAAGKSAFTSMLTQLLALLYKELLFRKFHCIATSFHVILPTLVAVIPCMVFHRLTALNDLGPQDREASKWVDFTTYEPLEISEIYGGVRTEDLVLAFAPTSDVTDELMEDSAREFFGTYDNEAKMRKLTSEEELRKYILENQKEDSRKVVIGTLFRGFGNTLPKDLDYKIYYPDHFKTAKKYVLNGPDTFNKYAYSVFTRWQAAVGNAFIKQKMVQETQIDYKIYMQKFPYPRYKQNPRSLVFATDFELYFHLAMVIFAAAIVKRIVEEKKDGSKELMESMGMCKSPYWASIFLSNFTIAFIFSLVIVTVYKTSLKKTFFLVQTDFMLFFIVLLFVMAHLILFCMAFSIFFDRAVSAMIALVMVYLVSHPLLAWRTTVDPSFESYFSLSLFHKLCICIHPVGALYTFCLIMQLFEAGNEGVLWKNLTEYPLVPDINLLMILGMIFFSYFFYAFAIWYLDAVWPWQPGVRKPFYFLFTKSYWLGEVAVLPYDIELRSENSTNFEEEPGSAVREVVIKDLCKDIQLGKSSKMVLRDVSLKCYQGQITAILGPNGAGKTSLIHIISGKELPTRGSISISGLNILTNTNSRPLGICPQHDVLFDQLSVEQHLKFYALMKGTSFGQRSNEVDQVLSCLKLSFKKSEMVSNLSYAEKRKLSLAIAIIGANKVLVLDEPTYGMDAESKKHVWDALSAMKQDRTVILTTQSLEEADILGDRIALMAEGEVHGCGTPAFIKQKLAAGYHMHILKDANFDSQGLKSLVTKHISTATCENDSPREASFNLGSSTDLGDLFEELDSRRADLGILSYGVSMSTIRDVSSTVSNMSFAKEAIENAGTENEDVIRDTFHPALHASLVRQFLALLTKHFDYCKRRWKFHIVQLTVPFLLMLTCFYCIHFSAKSPYKPLKLDISSVYGSTDGFLYVGDSGRLSGLADAFRNVLESNDVNVQKVSEPTHHVLNYGNQNLAKYLKRLVVGGAMDTLGNSRTLNLTAWYNLGSLHSLPMSLLLMQTSLLRLVADAGSMSLEIEPVMPLERARSPYPYAAKWWAQVFVPLVFTFISVTFLLVPVRERLGQAKLLQLMSGVPAVMYWFATFIGDLLMYLVICLLLILPPAFFFPSVFFGHSEAFGTLLGLFLLYAWASLPLGYIISTLLKRENCGLFIFIGFCLFFSVVSIVMLTNISLYYSIGSEVPPDKVLDSYWFFRLFPVYSISMGVISNFQIAFHNAACENWFTPEDFSQCASTRSEALRRCCKDICDKPEVYGEIFRCYGTRHHLSLKTHETYVSNGPEALYLALEGVVFFAVLLLFETRTATRIAKIVNVQLQGMGHQVAQILLRRRHQVLGPEEATPDPQVLREEERVRSLTATPGGEGLAVSGLAKSCVTSPVVNRLTFGVNKEECFGILGVKGAGKTSLLRMLVGEDIPSEGNAFVQSYSLMGDARKFRSHIGYCPEVDPLVDDLTGRETLLLFGQLRGLRGFELQKNVNELVQSSGLTYCADEQVQLYSGEDKRKLSVALALVGSPPVILLDEPTARVGPESCRQIWKVLEQARKKTGAAVLLATQSIEEIEALCDRLAVLVNGRIRCLGSPDQLKSRQGQGCAMTIKLGKDDQQNPERANALKNHIQSSLSNATLTDDYQGVLRYQVVDPSVTVGHLFKFMSDAKEKFELESCSIEAISLTEICSRA